MTALIKIGPEIDPCAASRFQVIRLVQNQLQLSVFCSLPADIYLLKVNNRNTRTRCEICSKLTTKTPERQQWRRSGVFLVNFEHNSHLALVLLLTLNM